MPFACLRFLYVFVLKFVLAAALHNKRPARVPKMAESRRGGWALPVQGRGRRVRLPRLLRLESLGIILEF